ncbi:MAG TPA: hypothetical protein VK100_08860 [Pseudogracilibacillus sp.]|nr:hypothetical protein [Pseudogracilibacillus sp.]
MTTPAAITSGMKGSALTVNIAFGDDDVQQWIEQLQSPYPLIFLDLEWAERYPSTIEMMVEKNITIGLLGKDGNAYMESNDLLEKQIDQYEALFQSKPLWFRTADEQFPKELLNALSKKEINALSSSIRWTGGKIKLEQNGEIVSVSSYKNHQIDFKALQQLTNDHPFNTIDQVLFNLQSKKKKIPN